MITPSTIMKCRTSCFSPFKFPLGDHESNSSPQIEVRKEMVFDKKKENKVIKNLSPTSKKCNKKVDLMNKGKEGVDDNGDSIRTVLSDQEYIVFSFREDGSFDVATDNIGAKSESSRSVDGKRENSKLVSRMLDYGEGAEQVRNQHIEKNISKANQQDTDQHEHDQVYLTPIKEDEAKETINLSPCQCKDNIRMSSQTEEIEDGQCVSIDSRISNQSEGSRGSFAFPKLAWEMNGSPAKMPKSEDLHPKKQKIRCVGFQCFRF